MVIHFEWHRTAMEQKSWSTLPLTGEDSGLEALASPLVGCLGKVQQRASSMEFCPWCSSKGMTYGLHLYRINLQESITLCTNPECLFPLVSQPLEDVLASLVPDESPIRGRRRPPAVVDQEELINTPHKRLRSDESDAPLVLEGHSATSGNSSKLSEKDSQLVNGCPKDSLFTTELDLQQNENAALGTETAACKNVPARASCSALAELQQSSPTLSTTDVELIYSPNDCTSQRNCVFDPSQGQSRCSPQDPDQVFHVYSKDTTATLQLTTNTEGASLESTGASIPPCAETQDDASLAHQFSSVTSTQSAAFVSFPDKLFWSNSNNLCWLDSMLVALVNCEGLRKRRPQDQPQESSVWQLIREYEAICAAVQVHQQPGRDGTTRVPQDALQKAHQDLYSLRMSVFKLLQPKLQCTLGQRETPVFALPLLLAMDLWAEPLFQATFQWEFACSGCQLVTRERVTKTLPTLTNILPEWGPLNAVHFASCNACGRKNQKRALVLQRVPPVLALHFVQGLPDNNVGKYAFSFEGMDYRITIVIQYNVQLRHFVTWVACSDGSWLEFDDLKHPEWKSHQTFPVRAEEMHVVFWEGEQTREPSRSGSSPLKTPVNSSCGEVAVSEEPVEQSLHLPHDDTDIMCALAAAAEDDEGSSTTAGIPAFADTSIGSATLLDTFEGLSHDDIVTLTLVEIATPSSGPPANATEWIPDTSWEVGPGRANSGVPAEHVAASNTTGYDGLADQPALSPSPLSAPSSAPAPSVSSVPAPSVSSAPASSPSSAPAPSPSPASASSPSPAPAPSPASASSLSPAPSPAPAPSPSPASASSLSPAPAPSPSPASSLSPAPSPSPAPAPSPSSAPAPAPSPSSAPSPAPASSLLPAPSPAPSPAPTLRRGRSRTKAATSGAATHAPSLTESPAESLLQMSPVSSTNPPVPSHPSPPPASTPTRPAAAPAPPTVLPTGRWSFLLSRNPKRVANSFSAAKVSSPAATRSNCSLPAHSTPDPVRRPAAIFTKPLLPPAKLEASDGLPIKAAEMYDGFGARSSQNRQRPTQPEPSTSRPSQPLTSLHHQPFSAPAAAGTTSLLEASLKKRHSSKVLLGLSEKEAQRYKQMKKLKAMKKKLAKLNQLLGHQDRPDSTGTSAGSPATVTSSTYEGSISEDLLLDLLSPATTASNLSPDSSGYLELLTTGHEGGEQPDAGTALSPQADHMHPTENFLEDFLSQAVAQRPTEMEADMLSALDLFI